MLIAGAALVAWFALTHLDARAEAALACLPVRRCAQLARCRSLLFAYAAQYLPASYLVILNAATPLFAAIAAAAWLGDRLTAFKVAGLALGAAGVAMVSRAGPVAPDAGFAVAVVASLCAALCYALAGVWLKRHGARLAPVAVAGWSQVFAALLLLPMAAATPLPASLAPWVLVDLLALALICSGVAYLLYYRLIADVGPTRAMTVTFLMPAFGMAWGALFLGERITPPMLAGAVMIVAGTAAVLRPAVVHRVAG